MLMTLPEMWDFLSLYLQYSFVQRAMIVTVLVALCSALLGVTLVLRRFSFIGDGLSHVAFGAMAVAAVLNLSSELPLVPGRDGDLCRPAAAHRSERKDHG